MSNGSLLQERIAYKGDLTMLLRQVSKEYHIGDFRDYSVTPIGYEDLNLVLSTTKGKYFVKIFVSFRDERECRRYIAIMTTVVEKGIAHPRLFSSSQGVLYETQLEGSSLFLCVMECIEGENFEQLRYKSSKEEMQFIIKEAALINTLPLKPYPLYDSWAVIHFLQEYKEKGSVLPHEDGQLLAPLLNRFSQLHIDQLPHCFVHGDIISTNIMKDVKGQLFIIDYSVANYYPRIQELAVLLCDVFFYPDDSKQSAFMYESVVNEYQKYIPLTEQEKDVLPFYIQFAHGMHLLRANYEKVANNYMTAENEYFLNIGRSGLKMSYIDLLLHKKV